MKITSNALAVSLLGTMTLLAACAEEEGELATAPTVALSSSATKGEDVQRQEQKAYGYLQRYGYLNEKPPADPQLFSAELKNALQVFQELYHLPADGTLNAATLAKMAQPRCGHSDADLVKRKLSGDPSASYVLNGAWTNRAITYRHINFTADLAQLQTEQVVEDAFEKWTTANSQISISKASPVGDIHISFAVGDHGDGTAFDGPGSVLAHAYGPGSQALNGDIHFDDAETWTLDGLTGFSLPSVALHEIGHALGLGHTTAFGSIMLASYSGQESLGSDDILGIQNLYPALSAPNPITNYNEACFGANQVVWTPQTGATSYQLYRSSTAGFTSPILIYNGAETSQSLDVTGSGWYLRAKACNGAVCSNYSNTVFAQYVNSCM